MKDDNCEIDAVGFELHIDKNFQDFSGVKQNIKRYNEINIKVHITELEVRCNTPGNLCEIDETDPEAVWTQEMLEKQARVYKELLKICLEAENCENFQFWDFVDGHTAWTPVAAPQNPYILAKNYLPKPAFTAVRDTLRDFSRKSMFNFERDHPAVIARLNDSIN